MSGAREHGVATRRGNVGNAYAMSSFAGPLQECAVAVCRRYGDS